MRRQRAGDVKLAVGYLRVSTDEQALGPQAQRAAIEAWAKRESIVVASWHLDAGVGGATPADRRPALLAALGDLRELRAGVLVAAKRDRLARDVVVSATIESLVAGAGARVLTADGVAVGDGPEAALMRSLIDAIAQYERAIIRARTRSALQVKRARGELVGTAPLGTRVAADGVRLEVDPVEGPAVAKVLELRRRGLSIRRIAAELDRLGVPCRGQRWHRQSVHRVLVRARAVPPTFGS